MKPWIIPMTLTNTTVWKKTLIRYAGINGSNITPHRVEQLAWKTGYPTMDKVSIT